MAKTKRKLVHHSAPKAAKKGSLFQQLFHKKHRPLHAAGLGILLVLLKGVLAIFATVGIIIILISAFAYIWRAAQVKHH